MPLRIATTALFAACLLFTSLVHAAADLREDLNQLRRLREAVNVQADSVQYAEGERKVIAKGNVRIGLEGRSVAADEVSVDLDDQVFVATGHVILVDGLNRLEGDRIEYNYRTNRGTITNARGHVGPGVSISGKEIRREGERTYEVTEGRFTTCSVCQPEPEIPDWEARAKSATVYQDEFVVSHDTSFWIKGIPTLYSPVLALPIGPRRTGFLIPRFGYGNSDGFVVKQPFFWAISPSQDLTVTPTYRTKRGLDLQTQYRYLLSEQSRGEASVRYLYDITPSAPNRNREEIKWQHDQILAPTWTAKADVRYQSDTSVNRNFVDNSVLERTRATLPSNLFVTQMTPQYMFLSLLNYTEDLTGGTTTKEGRVPDIRFQWLPSQLLGTPLIGEGDTSAVYLARNQGIDTGRFDIHPGARLPLRLSPWLTATSVGAFRETAYSGNEQRSGGGANRVLPDLGERIASRFGRQFESPGFGLLRLTHIVEPTLTYQYIPWWDQQSLPQFDPIDFISPENRVYYQLTNRLVARWREADGSIRNHEVATFDIVQSVNLMPRTREFSNVYLTGLTPERVDQAVKGAVDLGNGFSRARERTLSNLVFNAVLSPVPMAAIRGTFAYNTEQNSVDAINTGLLVHKGDALLVELASTFARNQEANGLVGRIQWRVTRSILVDYLSRYDIHSGTFLENGVNLRYTSCCWEVNLKYTYRSHGPTLKQENSFHATFDLKFGGPTPSGTWEGFKPSGESTLDQP